jgi:cytochrome c-type biogenesis protein
MLASLGLAFLAGAVSIVSPCVIPLLPIILGTAASEGRLGPVALGAGVVVSFVSVGLFIALIGFSIGLDAGFFRTLAATMLVGVGAVLLIPALQTQFATAIGPIGNWAQDRAGSLSAGGTASQFGVGLLLGAVWAPCVGPTLGAASLLAAQGKDLPHVFLTMLMFGIGVALPLAAIGLLSRHFLQRTRERMMNASRRLKFLLGGTFILMGGLILLGLDKPVEAALVNASPEWLTRFTTQF